MVKFEENSLLWPREIPENLETVIRNCLPSSELALMATLDSINFNYSSVAFQC